MNSKVLSKIIFYLLQDGCTYRICGWSLDIGWSFRLSPEEGDGVIERLFKKVEGTFDLQACIQSSAWLGLPTMI